MARTRYKPEEIVAKLRQLEVLISQEQTMADAIRQRRQPIFDPEPMFDPEKANAKVVRLWSVLLFLLFAIAYLIWGFFWVSRTGFPVPR
jgi:hypothetical protein